MDFKDNFKGYRFLNFKGNNKKQNSSFRKVIENKQQMLIDTRDPWKIFIYPNVGLYIFDIKFVEILS